MSTDPQEAPRPLPDRPSLRHLKDQAKDLLKTGAAASITDAQFKVARLYGFGSWPKLKAHVESFEEIGQLKQAIDANDIVREDDDDAQPGAARGSSWLRKRWAAHVGRRMPRAVGAT